MSQELLSALAPLCLVLAVICLVPPALRTRLWMRRLLVAGLCLMVLRYFHWRIGTTVIPAAEVSAEFVLVATLLIVEILIWLDTSMIFLGLLRPRDRSLEADRHEARLARTPESELPVVDVLIPTYDEEFAVLERTITGACALDWPEDKLRIHVLDDGKRDWLAAYARERGIGYVTRPDNAGAKAGNINAALKSMTGAFFLVLDADFIPRRHMIRRMIGFFEDPRIGIVQAPHYFFNADPMQSSLGMEQIMPNDQAMFFDVIMPARDSLDCAFCCGSNSLTRREALRDCGDALPTGSVTEDLLLTLVMLRKGYVTRYLHEALAVGLAPESLKAFFVQRARWARGAIQILYLRAGPFGPGLTLLQRWLFTPVYWITQSVGHTLLMVAPILFLWFGITPIHNATLADVMAYQVATVVATLFVLRCVAPDEFFPFAQIAHGMLQAFRLFPTIAMTLLRPSGHAFKVTPKGSQAGGSDVDRATIVICLSLLLGLASGLAINARFETARIDQTVALPVTAFWGMVNALVLLMVARISVVAPEQRQAQVFSWDQACRVSQAPDSASGATPPDGPPRPGRIVDLSTAGARIEIDVLPPVGSWIRIDIDEIGAIPALVRRHAGARPGAAGSIGVEFHLPSSPVRRRLIRELFTRRVSRPGMTATATRISWMMISRTLFRVGPTRSAPPARTPLDPPAWARVLVGEGPEETAEAAEAPDSPDVPDRGDTPEDCAAIAAPDRRDDTAGSRMEAAPAATARPGRRLRQSAQASGVARAV